MGNKPYQPLPPYAVPLDGQSVEAGQTPVYKTSDPRRDAALLSGNGKTLQDALRVRFQSDADQQRFCWRRTDPQTGALTRDVVWMTNREFQERAEALGSSLLWMNLCPEVKEYRNLNLRFLGFYAKHTINYLIADTACLLYGITTAPIYDTLGEEATAFAFRQTGMTTCLVDCKHVSGLLDARKKDPSYKALKTIIVSDPENWKGDRPMGVEVDGVTLLSMEALVQSGRQKPMPWATLTPESIYAFSYTSGTSGEPKAAMLSHGNFVHIFTALDTVLLGPEPDIHLSYLPMAHVMERLAYNYFMTRRGTICVYNGDVMKLKEDLAIFRPTIFLSVPRLYNRFFDAILQGVREKGCVAQTLFSRGLSTKLANLHSHNQFSHWLWDRLVFNKVKQAMGGRVRLMAVGSAPISAEVLDSLKVIFGCPIVEVYGQTEGLGLGFHTSLDDPFSGHVGGPSLVNEFKLVDVPEMNYTALDLDAQGRPNPRGEIWCRGPLIIPGYYKNDQQNAETFSSDGWLRSGDIGMLVGPERRLRIIDRKKNIFKLSQGEYIAPEKLEAVYKTAHPSIGGIYVYGDSLKNNLVGILNVEPQALVKFARDKGIAGEDPAVLARDPAIIKAYIALFDAQAKEHKFNSLEKLKNLKIETRTFQSLGLLTETMKTKRFAVKQMFQDDLNALYDTQQA